ncbi:nitroreductase [Lawsonibacter celer]|jgi:nitroreductase|uniref:nitroreductase n=1 Tax=Lawsonibacter celer TaxID=2986526 RepID=UPI00164484A7|nr:nitroreductase [Lawsonibacter celer]
MKTTLEDLKNRRSCRTYRPEQITEEELEQVLQAGMYAPTGSGKQSPRIVAIQNAEVIGQLKKMNAALLGNPEADPFYGAPTVVVVLADRSCPTYLYDGSCVMDNLMNAAEAVGLGSCWIHRAREEFESDQGKALLRQWGIEGDYEGIGHCLLGYRAGERPDPAPRKKDYIVRVN